MTRHGDIILDDQGREIARRIKGWWYTFGTDATGLPEYDSVDPDLAAEYERAAIHGRVAPGR